MRLESKVNGRFLPVTCCSARCSLAGLQRRRVAAPRSQSQRPIDAQTPHSSEIDYKTHSCIAQQGAHRPGRPRRHRRLRTGHRHGHRAPSTTAAGCSGARCKIAHRHRGCSMPTTRRSTIRDRAPHQGRRHRQAGQVRAEDRARPDKLAQGHADNIDYDVAEGHGASDRATPG